MPVPEYQQLYTLLKEVDFLYKLSFNELNFLIERLKRLEIKKGLSVIKQGESGDSF